MDLKISKIRKARKGEIPTSYAIEHINMNDAVVEMRTREYSEYCPVRLPVTPEIKDLSLVAFTVHDTPRRKAMLGEFKKLHVKGENRISYRYRVTCFARKAFVWLCFWLAVFCVAYTVAGLFVTGFAPFKIW